MIEPRPEKVCIYHANCTDGFGAAYAMWKRWKDAEYIPASYGGEPPDVAGKDVYVLDFSYSEDQMRELAEKANSVTVLDHHKTAQEALQKLIDERVIDGEFNMDKSGAVLAWEYFHVGEPVPQLLLYVQDRDLWRWELRYTKEVILALRSYDMDFQVWDELTDDIYGLTLNGHAINRYYQKQLQELVSQTKVKQRVCGHDVWVANVPGFMASEAGHILGEGMPFALTYYEKGGVRYFSARSAEDGVDVSEIAKLHGGGGHKHAAGFKLEEGQSLITDGI